MNAWLSAGQTLPSEQGARALDVLRDGVKQGSSTLGSGFLSPSRQRTLRESLQSGRLSRQDLHRELLRLVYRFIFLFVSEDRALLLDPEASDEAKKRYLQWFSTRRLRKMAEHRRGTSHPDLYASAARYGKARLGLPGTCSAGAWEFPLVAKGSSNLGSCESRTATFSRRLDHYPPLKGRGCSPNDYRNLGSEELGSVYEALLELHPKLDVDAGSFELSSAVGHRRKTTGSITPASLVDELLNSALTPVLEEAVRSG